MHKLLLMVTDAFMLERGTLPYCYFDSEGGIVGSAINASWKINNWKNEVADVEFEIIYYNGSFCLITHSKKIFMNYATRPIPLGGIIRLNDNDLISLANYKIRAKIFTNEAEVVTLQDELSHLLNKQTVSTILNLEHYQQYSFDLVNSVNQDLLELKANDIGLDPLLALKVDEGPSWTLVDDIPRQDISAREYKFFNPNILSVSEYYAPPDITSSLKRGKPSMLNTNSQCDVLQNTTSSSSKNVDVKQEEAVLDPLFFIK